MAYGVNRAGEQPRAMFQRVGGTTLLFQHPYLLGQLANSKTGDMKLDSIDVSSCVKLDGDLLDAEQGQDSAKQVVLLDGSVVTICNKNLNGGMTVNAVETTGEVATGDFIAACQLVKSVGDTVGGLFTIIRNINGKTKVRVFYGVTVQNCPDMKLMGNDVAVYPVKLFYAGYLDANGASASEAMEKIWAVGSAQKIQGIYHPYPMQNADGAGGSKDGVLKKSDTKQYNVTQSDSSTGDVAFGSGYAQNDANAATSGWSTAVGATGTLISQHGTDTINADGTF
jgi:hypothetical protein